MTNLPSYYLEELLKPDGEIKSSEKVSAEIKEIDVLYHVRQITHNKRTPPPTPPRKRGGELKRSFSGFVNLLSHCEKKMRVDRKLIM